MYVIVPRHAHEQILHRGHIVHAVILNGYTVLVVKEIEVLLDYAVAEVEIYLHGVVQFDVINAVALDVREIAHRVHRESYFQLVDILYALSESDLNGDGADQFVHAEKVLYRLVGGGDADDVGFERRPRILHQRADYVRKTQNDVVVLFGVEVITHIRIEAAHEMVFPYFEPGHSLDTVVLQPDIPQFLDGIGGIQTDVVRVNVSERRYLVLDDHIQIQRKRASGLSGPTPVLEILFPDVLVVIECEINVRGFGQYERSVQPRFVAHERAEKLRKIDFLGRREYKLTFEITRISHYFLELVKVGKIGEHDPDVFADMLRIQIQSHYQVRTVRFYFFLRHFRSGVKFQTDTVIIDVVGQIEIRGFYQFFDADARNRSNRLDIDVELIVDQ